MLKTAALLNIFVDTVIKFFFQDYLMKNCSKEQLSFEIEIFWNINRFAGTLNKTIDLLNLHQ